MSKNKDKKSTLISKLIGIKGQLERTSKFVNAIHESSHESSKIVNLVNARLTTLEPLLGEYSELHRQLLLVDPSEGYLNEIDECDELYHNLVAECNELIQKHSNSDALPARLSAVNNYSNQLVLPKLKLPIFSGSYTEFLPFYDSFVTLIDSDARLSECQKLQYLKSCLKDEALRTIQALSGSNANYKSALELLVKRYKHPRLIIFEHISSIINAPSIEKGTCSNIRQLLDVLAGNLEALKVLKLPTTLWDDLLVVILTSKLDYATRKDWEKTLSTEMPKLQYLIDFLERRSQSLNPQVSENVNIVNKRNPSQQKLKGTYMATTKFDKRVLPKCPLCNGTHLLYNCKEFLNLSFKDRNNKVKEFNLCKKCIRLQHQLNDCKYVNCKYPQCGAEHNILLHVPREESVPENQTLNVALSRQTKTYIKNNKLILLSTVLINVQDNLNNVHECRALLDVGSQINIVSLEFCKKLNLNLNKVTLPISGINQNVSTVKYTTDIKLHSRYNEFKSNLKCMVLPKLTENIPSYSFCKNELKIPDNVQLADPKFYISTAIDLIIGAELFWQILCTGRVNYSNQPCFQETQFGWVAGGVLNSPHKATYICNLAESNVNGELDGQVRKFWEIEEYQQYSMKSREESVCENLFLETVKRDHSGRFIVHLPIKDNQLRLGASDKVALQRFYALERKLRANLVLKGNYVDFIREYLELDHMELVPNNEINNKNVFYLPHHAVIKEDSLTTKLRVVFDGSAQSSNGLSLNDNLINGPLLQQDLFAILIRYRKHQFVINADITKMYRMINVIPHHSDLQRIFWRENPEDPLKIFRLKTVTYGTTSASFLAVRCMMFLADEYKATHPLACKAIKIDFYMDDLLTGSDNLNEVKQLKENLTHILANGGFNLCKWSSNHPLIANDNKSSMIKLDKSGDRKLLGLWWNSNNDCFKYRVQFKDEKRVSKRVILSTVAQIFDPLGLIGPIIVKSKIIMQRLWSINLGWDDKVPNEIEQDWNVFLLHLREVEKLEIPRKVKEFASCSNIEIHCFCDASQEAYGATIYIRTTDSLGIVCVKLLCSKSRIAPLKTISIPRLELCGALLAARLTSRVLEIIDLKFDNVYYWTDSTIVLSWLSETSSNWSTFVANRVGEIHSLTSCCNWHHVGTLENPADIISRGVLGDQLINLKLWWQGPSWLTANKVEWPSSKINLEKVETPERKTKKSVNLLVINEYPLYERFSSYLRLQRVVAYCKRFCNNCRNKENRRLGDLSVQEMQAAEISIIKLMQSKYYKEELENLKLSREISKNSNIYNLNPFVDNNGLIRVGGRLANSSLANDKKHPFVLHSKHFITKLLIVHYHKLNLHSGSQATLFLLRQRFWIVSARDIIRKTIFGCMTCFKSKPRFFNQKMGNLPLSRLEPVRPFIKTGIDYAGPILIKESTSRNSRKVKAYMAIFICFATKAIHLELVGDLTSDSFLGALKRFISRRGHVSDMFSDNGTNFVGANNQLTKFFKSVKFTSVDEHLKSKNINWHFIPSHSPHMGGLWEAGVKSVKFHLNRVVGNACLKYEEMYTLLTLIEACLNSRPLTPVSQDPADLSALTPGHFLIGDVLAAPIEPDLLPLNSTRLSRWQHVEQIRQHFWKRWSVEYLSTLQKRIKWNKATVEPIKIGDLVVLRDNNLPPLNWRMGRIESIHPGKDKLVRVVGVKTASGIVKRAINKVCVLPLD